MIFSARPNEALIVLAATVEVPLTTGRCMSKGRSTVHSFARCFARVCVINAMLPLKQGISTMSIPNMLIFGAQQATRFLHVVSKVAKLT
eukprot:4781852-Pleurochrysis_carterae.AAC.2